jgi:hypothetical protein
MAPMFRLCALVLLLLFPALCLAEPRREMSAAELMEALTSPEPAVRDRANRALSRLNNETATGLAREVLRANEYEARLVLGSVRALSSVDGGRIALTALGHRSEGARLAALRVLGSLSFAELDALVSEGLSVAERRAVRDAVGGTAFMLAYCIEAASSGGDPEYLVRMVVFLDRVYGPEGWCMIVRSLVTLLETEAVEAEEPDDADNPEPEAGPQSVSRTLARQSASVRRAAREAIESILLTNIGTEFNYVPRGLPETRRRAIEQMRDRIEQLETKPVQTMQGEYKGSRYGDYLQSLFSHDVADIRAAAYLRMRWMKGEELPLAGEDYAKAVDEFLGLSRREISALRRELRTWWADFRTKADR